MIKFITFDLDNTLWEVTPVIVRAEKTMREWLQRRVPDYDTRVTGQLMSDLRESALRNQPQLRYNISDLRVLLLPRLYLTATCQLNKHKHLLARRLLFLWRGATRLSFIRMLCR